MHNSQSAVFELNQEPLKTDPTFAGFIQDIAKLHRIESQESFNAYCKEVCLLWTHHFEKERGSTSNDFSELSARISCGAVDDDIIPTPWGGVVVTKHQHPEVEKYLVIRKGGYLALEKHTKKYEQLEVIEGRGLLLSRENSDTPLDIRELKPNDKYNFSPGMEHCIIGTEDLLIFEKSTDPKGMDQDLIFIYTPNE